MSGSEGYRVRPRGVYTYKHLISFWKWLKFPDVIPRQTVIDAVWKKLQPVPMLPDSFHKKGGVTIGTAFGVIDPEVDRCQRIVYRMLRGRPRRLICRVTFSAEDRF